MNKQHTLDIAAFVAQTWLIDPEIRDILFAQVITDGKLVLSLDETPIHYTDFNWAYYAEAPKKNSTAIITISGVIYDYYAQYICAKLEMIFADKNVTKLLVKMNSPGGAADAGYRIANALTNAPIPTWCHIEYGQASSAGYMIGCSCDGMSASRANDRVGSIGTYISYQDWSKYYEKLGIVSKDIYADQSTEKNLEGREAAKGNFKPLETYVSKEAASFIDYVKDRRPNLKTGVMDPFKGKVFSATDALAIGLIDSICSLKEAVKSLNSSTTTTNTTPRTTMFGYAKVTALLAVAGIAADSITPEQVKAINAELTAMGITGVAAVSQKEFTDAVEASTKGTGDGAALATAQAEVTRLTTERDTLKNSVTNLTTERDNLKTQVTTLGSLNGAEKTTVVKGAETQADAGEVDAAQKEIDELPHNKALIGGWLYGN